MDDGQQVRRQADVALFVVSRPADRFDAIEQPAAVTGLPVVRAEREIDPQLLRSAELGFLNGRDRLSKYDLKALIEY